MEFHNRPSISPVVAGLFCGRLIKKKHSVIDLGCGSGVDCVSLAFWGVRRVDGIDMSATALKKAAALAQKFRIPPNQLRLHEGSITKLHHCFNDSEFDIAIDSLLWNNIAPQATPAYVRQVTRILKPGGKLILQIRYPAPRIGFASAQDLLPPSFTSDFAFGPVVATDIPEFRTKGRKHAHARIALCIGSKRK
jgi:SAM-dependent methyltransferase